MNLEGSLGGEEVELDSEEEERVDWVFVRAREDITPPIMAMPMVPGVC
jgi:hypothetical protein